MRNEYYSEMCIDNQYTTNKGKSHYHLMYDVEANWEFAISANVGQLSSTYSLIAG